MNHSNDSWEVEGTDDLFSFLYGPPCENVKTDEWVAWPPIVKIAFSYCLSGFSPSKIKLKHSKTNISSDDVIQVPLQPSGLPNFLRKSRYKACSVALNDTVPVPIPTFCQVPLDYQVRSNKSRFGYDDFKKLPVDLVRKGLVDPLKPRKSQL